MLKNYYWIDFRKSSLITIYPVISSVQKPIIINKKNTDKFSAITTEIIDSF